MSDEGQNGSGDLLVRLRRLRVDPPDDGFQSRLHRRLVEAGPPGPASAWQRLRDGWTPLARLGWVALGVAVGVGGFALLGPQRARAPGPGSPSAEVAATELPSTKVAVIRLNLTADTAVASAAIEVQLPEGLVFWSGGRALPQRSFAWSQPLAAGGNDIPIAVRGERPGRYRVRVKARIGGEQVEDEISLEVVAG